MKKILAIIFLTFSLNTFAFVNQSNCPKQFTITYFDISRGPLSKDIIENPTLVAAWNSIQKEQKFEQTFFLVEQTFQSYCTFSNGHSTAYLHTNKDQDELIIPYKNNLFFRTKVLSFSEEYVELAVDESSKEILVSIQSPSTDGRTVVTKELEVGEAEAVNIQVY